MMPEIIANTPKICINSFVKADFSAREKQLVTPIALIDASISNIRQTGLTKKFLPDRITRIMPKIVKGIPIIIYRGY